MNDADLLIEIGASTTAFNKSVQQMRKKYDDMVNYTANNPLLTVDAGAFAKEMRKVEKEVKKVNKELRSEMAQDVYGKAFKNLSKNQKQNLTKYMRQYKKNIAEIARAEKKANEEVAAHRAKLAKEALARRKKIDNYLFQRRLRQYKKERAERAERAKTSSSGKWGNIESVKHAFKTTALYGGMAQALFGVQAAMKAVAGEAVRMNDAMYQNIAVLQKTKEESMFLVKAVSNIGSLYGGDLAAIQEAMITLGRAGVDQTDILANSTKVLRELALITGDDMRDGAEAMSSLINVYGIAGDEIRNLGDQMAYVTNATRLGIKDLSTISNYALVAAKNIGLTKESYFALNGVLSKAGLNASTAGTSIRRFNKILYDGTVKNTEMFRILGFEQKKFADAMAKDSNKALQDFVNQLLAVDDVTYKKAVGEMDVLTRQLIDGLRGGGQFLEGFIDNLNKAKEGEGTLQKQAEDMSQGITISFERIWNSVKSGATGFMELKIEVDEIYEAGRNAALGLSFVIKALDDIVAFIPLINRLATAIGQISTNGVRANINKTIGKTAAQLREDIKVLNKDIKTSEDQWFFNDSDGAKNNRIALKKQIAAKERALEVLKATGAETLAQTKAHTYDVNGPKETAKVRETLAAKASEKGLEFARKRKIIEEQLNGTYSKSKHLREDILSLQKKQSKLLEQDKDATVNVKDDLERVSLDIVTKKLALKKELTAEEKRAAAAAKKASGSTAKAARVVDKSAKEQMKINKEIYKQKLLQYKIDMQKGKLGYSLESDSLKVFKKKAKLATKLREDNAKLVKGVRSEAEYQKSITDEYQAKYDLLVKMTAEMDKWENMFTDLFSGDLVGAINTAFEDVFTGLQKQMAEMAGGADSMVGSMVGGLTGAAIQFGLDAIGKLTKKTISAEELKAAEGITTQLSPTVENSIDRIEANSTTGLKYSSEMVDSLKRIVSLTMKSAGNIGSDITGENYVASTDYGFFNDEAKELVSSGIKLASSTLDQLRNDGIEATKYMTEKITDSGFLGIGAGEELKTTNLGAAGDEITGPITEAYLASVELMSTAAEALGVSADEFSAAAAQWETSIANLNFEGKSPEEISEMINGVIAQDMATLADSLASVAPYIEEFKKAGEDAGETIIRLANDFEVVSRAFRDMGQVLPDVASGGLAAAEALIDAAGGMDKFANATKSFIDHFYTDSEKQAMAMANLAISFEAVGLTLPSTTQAMKALYLQIQTDLAAKKIQLDAAKKKFAADVELANATIQLAGRTSAAARQALAAAAQSEAILAGLQSEFTNLDTQFGMLTNEMDNITMAFPSMTDVMGDAAQTAEDAAASLQELNDQLEELRQNNYEALNIVGDIFDYLLSGIAKFQDAMQDLFEKLEIRTMSLDEALKWIDEVNIDNYQSILQQLDESRKQDEDDIKLWHKNVAAELKKQTAYFEDMSKAFDTITKGVEGLWDLAKGKTVERTGTEFFKIQEEFTNALANGDSVTGLASELVKAGKDYVTAMRANAGTSQEAEFETLRVAAMMESTTDGLDPETELSDIEDRINEVNEILERELSDIQLKYEQGVVDIIDALNDEFDVWITETKEFYSQFAFLGQEFIDGIEGLHELTSTNDALIYELNERIASNAASREWDINTNLKEDNWNIKESQDYTRWDISNVEEATKLRLANSAELKAYQNAKDIIDGNATEASKLWNATTEGTREIREAAGNANTVAWDTNAKLIRSNELFKQGNDMTERMELWNKALPIVEMHNRLSSLDDNMQNRVGAAMKWAMNDESTSAYKAAKGMIDWANKYGLSAQNYFCGVAQIVGAIGAIPAATTTTTINNIASASPSPQPTPAVPFAQGGIVTRPTNALIGEAGYNEAVVPLKDPNDPLGNIKIADILERMDERLSKVEHSNERIATINKKQLTSSYEQQFLFEERL